MSAIKLVMCCLLVLIYSSCSQNSTLSLSDPVEPSSEPTPEAPVLVPGTVSLVQTIYKSGATEPDNSALTGEASVAADMAEVEGMTISPDDKFIYTADGSSKRVTVYQIDSATGKLTFVEKLTNVDVPGMIYPFDLAVSPDGNFLYVTDMDFTGGSRVLTFERNLTTGALTYPGTKDFLDTSLTDIAGSMIGFSGIAITPDGKNIYLGNYYDGHFITLARNTVNGVLSYTEGNAWAGPYPWSVGVSSDGSFVWYSDDGNNVVKVYDRNLTDGSLTENLSLAGLNSWSSHMSSDTGLFYATSYSGDKISISKKDVDNNFLFVEEYSSPVETDGLVDVFVAADVKSVYTVSMVQSAILIYDVDTTGSLTLRQSYSMGGVIGTTISGIRSPEMVLSDSAGRFLYVTAKTDVNDGQTILVFEQEYNAQ